MVQEIISIQIGQCGNQIGSSFWDEIRKEHSIELDGQYTGNKSLLLDRLGVYFQETNNEKYVPRCILGDLDSHCLDGIRSGKFRQFFGSDNYVFDEKGGKNNFGTGYNNKEVIETIMDVIRKEAEQCDCLQGFQFIHSVCGGAGSGIVSKLLELVADSFTDRLNFLFTLYPSDEIVNSSLVEPMNAVLAFKYIEEYQDLGIVLNNGPLYKTCFQKLKIVNPQMNDINKIISLVMSGITCTMRFPGILNTDIRKLATNLVPFKKLTYCMCGFSPIEIGKSEEEYTKIDVEHLVKESMNPSNCYTAADYRHGRYVTCSFHFRGEEIKAKDVDEWTLEIQNKGSSPFVEWIPNNVKSTICSVSSNERKKSSTFIANCSSVKEMFSKMNDRAMELSHCEKKKYFHFFENEGVEELTMKDAQDLLSDKVFEWTSYQDATADSDVTLEDEEEEEEEGELF